MKEGNVDSFKTAHGVKSNSLKFRTKICDRCNSNVTQESDRAFDALRKELSDYSAEEIQNQKIWSAPDFKLGGLYYTPMFRYFAKLLGCHLAEIGAPIPVHLSNFVRKHSPANCIWLGIRSNPELEADGQVKSSVSQGGLTIITKKPSFQPLGIASSVTFGTVQYFYQYRWTWPEKMEMRLLHKDFVKECVVFGKRASENPMNEKELQSVGLDF